MIRHCLGRQTDNRGGGEKNGLGGRWGREGVKKAGELKWFGRKMGEGGGEKGGGARVCLREKERGGGRKEERWEKERAGWEEGGRCMEE